MTFSEHYKFLYKRSELIIKKRPENKFLLCYLKPHSNSKDKAVNSKPKTKSLEEKMLNFRIKKSENLWTII